MFLEPPASQILELEGVRVASGKFWSDIAGQRLCAFGGRLLVAATTVRTGLSVHSGVVAVAARIHEAHVRPRQSEVPDQVAPADVSGNERSCSSCSSGNVSLSGSLPGNRVPQKAGTISGVLSRCI